MSTQRPGREWLGVKASRKFSQTLVSAGWPHSQLNISFLFGRNFIILFILKNLIILFKIKI